MKKKFLFLLVLIFSTYVAAENGLTFESYNNELAPGETFQAEYSFDKEIIDKQIYLIKPSGEEYKPGLIDIDLGERNYFYFYIPGDFIEGEYQLVIKKRVFDNGFLREMVDKNNLTIKNIKGLRIETPIIRLGNKPEFRIRLLNVGEESVTLQPVKDNFSIPFRETLDLNKGERKDFLFKTKSLNFGLKYLFIDSGYKTYKIPILSTVSLFEEKIQERKEESKEEDKAIIFLTKKEGIEMSLQKTESRSGYVKFEALRDLEDVEVIFSGDVREIASANVSLVGNLKKNQVYTLDLIINKNQDGFPGEYSGFLNILYRGGSATMSIVINIFESLEEENNSPIEKKESEMKDAGEVLKEIKNGVDARYLIVAFLVLCSIVYIFYNIGKKPYKPKNVKETYMKFKK